MPSPFKINKHDSTYSPDSRMPTLRSRHDGLSTRCTCGNRL